MVLLLIAIVSFSLTLFIERAQVEIKGEGYYSKRNDLRKDAWSMMEVAVAVLADVKQIDGALYAPAQGWSDPLDYAGIAPREGLAVSFQFEDQSGKMNINALGEDSLILLFDELGFDLDVSMRLTAVLLDWIDEDDSTRIDGAETREYSTLELEAHPANQPLRSLGELRYLFGFRELFFDERGLPLPVFEALAQAVTVYEINSLNANTASPLALRSLADLDDIDVSILNDYLAGFDGVVGTADDNYFATREDLGAVLANLSSGAPVGNQISVLTVRVTVEEYGYSYTLVGTLSTESEAPAIEESGGNISYPFLFLELREEPGANNARPW